VLHDLTTSSLSTTRPPPESCGRLRAYAPAGGWLIHRPTHEPHYVDVSVYDAYQPGIVITIGLFDVDTCCGLHYLSGRLAIERQSRPTIIDSRRGLQPTLIAPEPTLFATTL
jgi:hypothetical protein